MQSEGVPVVPTGMKQAKMEHGPSELVSTHVRALDHTQLVQCHFKSFFNFHQEQDNTNFQLAVEEQDHNQAD